MKGALPFIKRQGVADQAVDGIGGIADGGQGLVDKVLVVACAKDFQFLDVEPEEIDRRGIVDRAENDHPSAWSQRLQAQVEGLSAADGQDGHINPGSAIGLGHQLNHVIIRAGPDGDRPLEVPETELMMPNHDCPGRVFRGQQAGNENVERPVTDDEDGIVRTDAAAVDRLKADGHRFQEDTGGSWHLVR